jgi:ferritin-like metal-binding protein YciE
MPAHSLQELFVEEMRDMYDGEKRLTKALPQMARAASSEELRTAFMNHLKETERQVTRLEQVFRTFGETARGKTCDGIVGIVEEGKKAMAELDGAVLDAALIAGAQKVEHYEIATYGTLAYFAELLGNEQAKDLLGETLDGGGAPHRENRRAPAANGDRAASRVPNAEARWGVSLGQRPQAIRRLTSSSLELVA